MMEEIIGKEFSSFCDLDMYFKEIQKKYREIFYKRSRKRIGTAKLAKMTNKNLIYSYILYHCKFDKERKTTSTGKRKSS